MVNKGLKLGEMKKLIELCGKNGVSELSLGDFKVVFGNQTKEIPLTPTAIQTKEADAQSQVVEQEALIELSRDLDENALAIMQVEDPVRYEQLMVERELEDVGTDGAGLDEFEQSIADRDLARTQTSYHS